MKNKKNKINVFLIFQYIINIGIVAAIIFIVFQLQNINKQIKQSENKTSADLVFKFDEQLNTPKFIKLIHYIENKKPVLKQNNNGGEFTTDDLESYLSIYETMAGLYNSKLISKGVICSNFSNYIIKTYYDKEILDYINSLRNASGELGLYRDFENLAKDMIPFETTKCPTE